MPFGKDAVKMKDVSREVDVKDFIAKEVPYFFLNFGFILLQQIEQPLLVMNGYPGFLSFG